MMTICALTFVAPYYDCSEHWDIIVYDDSIELLKCGDVKPQALGCSTYYGPFRNDMIELVHDHDEIMGLHSPKLKGGGILMHELLHQMCECNWHEKWDVQKEKRSHKFSKEIKIPETIISYLKEEWIK